MGGSVEAIARAWVAKPSAWLGGEGGSGVFRSGSRAEFAGGLTAGIADCDLALLLWECGVDDPAVRGAVWARLMVVGSHAASQASVRWPKGMLSGLVAVAMAELAQRPGSWTDTDRRLALALAVSQSAWSRTWGQRYRELLDAAAQGAARARWRIGQGRGGED